MVPQAAKCAQDPLYNHFAKNTFVAILFSAKVWTLQKGASFW